MEYPSVLGALAIFFGFIAVLMAGLKFFSPEPPPKGGVAEYRPKMSFREFNQQHVKEASRQATAAYAAGDDWEQD